MAKQMDGTGGAKSSRRPNPLASVLALLHDVPEAEFQVLAVTMEVLKVGERWCNAQ